MGGNDSTPDEHIHEWKFSKIMNEPSCLKQGLALYVCDCGQDCFQEIPITEHDIVDGFCTDCKEKFGSQGLSYSLAKDGTYYILTGMGNCKDKNVVIPDMYKGLPVTTIGEEAFRGWYSLLSVEIPETVTTIGSYAFAYCSQLASIEIPDSVTSMDGFIFYNCSSLVDVVIGKNVTSIKSYSFNNCTSLKNIEIPNNVTMIGRFAFKGCSGLVSLTIPDSVTEIGENAFAECSSLAEISLPFVGEKNTYLGYIFAADNYNNMVPKTLKKLTITSGFVANCSMSNSLTDVIIGDAVTGMHWGAFYSCNSLRNVVIGDGVKTIDRDTFALCQSLESVVIGSGVTYIGSTTEGFGNTVFELCIRLRSITVDENNKTYCSIDGNLYTKDKKTLVQYAIGSYATSFSIPVGVTRIGEFAFTYSKLQSIYIPEGVTSIGSYAFDFSTKLTNLVLPDTLESIEDEVLGSAFGNCDSLASVVIGRSVSYIGDWTFAYCEKLTSIRFNGTISEWYMMHKGHNWNIRVPATKVVCSDGEVQL